jgi:hypothetical protein
MGGMLTVSLLGIFLIPASFAVIKKLISGKRPPATGADGGTLSPAEGRGGHGP